MSQLNNDSIADDLAQEWIINHTKIELDSKPYRELVLAFLQFGNLQADENKRLRTTLDELIDLMDGVRTGDVTPDNFTFLANRILGQIGESGGR